jgi:hypothetical protein
MNVRSLAAAALLAAGFFDATVASAQNAPKARFSDAYSFTGKPTLTLTLATIAAGGGASDFKTVKLLQVLAGDAFKPEVDKLTKEYGADKVTSFITVFDFVINDSLRLVTEKKVALPATPAPNPNDGKALAAALYKAGIDSDGKFDVEYMLDNLVSHPVHVQVMDDIDVKYDRKADANYHIILTQAMTDLKAAYNL